MGGVGNPEVEHLSLQMVALGLTYNVCFRLICLESFWYRAEDNALALGDMVVLSYERILF